MNESKPLYNLATGICAYKFNLTHVLFFDQVELWFPSERDLPVPGDPTEPLAYDRLANLKKVMQQVTFILFFLKGVVSVFFLFFAANVYLSHLSVTASLQIYIVKFLKDQE